MVCLGGGECAHRLAELGVALAEILGPGDLLGDDLFLTGRALFRETRNIRLYVLREIFPVRWRPSCGRIFSVTRLRPTWSAASRSAA